MSEAASKNVVGAIHEFATALYAAFFFARKATDFSGEEDEEE